MEMTHRGAEGESLLRPDQRNFTVMSQTSSRPHGWEDPEKSPFIRNEPVRLTPAWEATNLPNDTLNLKGITMEPPPKDKWRLIYLTLVLHGLGTLVAWNMFITAKDYFVKYKLVGAPQYADNFLVYLGWASQIPTFVFSWVNALVRIGGNLTPRILCSLTFEVLIFLATTVMAMVDSSEWPELFFWFTWVSVFCLCAFNAIFQNSVYGLAARLPPQYMGAVVLGSNVCGTLIVLLNWASDFFSGSYRTAAIYYFIGGMFVLLVCFNTYLALPLNRFYRYHEFIQERTVRVNPESAPSTQGRHSVPYGTILKQCWVQLYNVFMIFFVTLAVFPAVISDIQPIQPGFLGNNFVRLTCFLTFNLFAMIGNITASFWQYPTRNWLAIFTTVRLLFIPFFVFCNYHPMGVVRTLPVLVNNDWVFWGVSVLLGWTSGHGSSLAMMYVGGKVAPENAMTAGMLGGATLGTGIIAGISFSILGPKIAAISA